jgi:hypothetical protein
VILSTLGISTSILLFSAYPHKQKKIKHKRSLISKLYQVQNPQAQHQSTVSIGKNILIEAIFSRTRVVLMAFAGYGYMG